MTSRGIFVATATNASPADRAAYEALKRELATRDWPDMNHYADAKGGLIREIRGRAGSGNGAG